MTTLNYTRRGQGEPLVLIHGTGGRLAVWDPVVPALSQHFDVIAIDLPGCGKTSAATDPTISSHIDAIAEFIGQLGLDRPHVAGNSIGGSIALERGFLVTPRRRLISDGDARHSRSRRRTPSATVRAAAIAAGQKALRIK